MLRGSRVNGGVVARDMAHRVMQILLSFLLYIVYTYILLVFPFSSFLLLFYFFSIDDK